VNKWARKRFEVFMISIARKILADRNVQRSAVVSRRDNNDMGYMAEKLEAVEARMLDGYNRLDGYE
jgi:hypothetical protein